MSANKKKWQLWNEKYEQLKFIFLQKVLYVKRKLELGTPLCSQKEDKFMP